MNLLIIMSDEHRKDAMGCMGHPVVKTPNLDALAANGALFTNAYTPSPMCVPTRASIACGDYVHRTGFWDSATPYDGSRRSWMHELRDAGVSVTSIGKLHYKSSDIDNGFSEEILPMHVVGGVGWTIGLLRENIPQYDSAKELAADVGSGMSSYTNYDLDITEATERYFNALADRQDTSQPWAAFVSLVSPHYPLTAPPEYYDMYKHANIDEPILRDDTSPVEHEELRNLKSFFNYGDYFDTQKIREAKVAYYGLTSFLDNCVGRVVSALERTQQLKNTLIVYVSDHGDMMGDLGHWTKMNMYEASAGVPMIVSGPGIAKGVTIKTAVSLIDLAPTALDVFSVSKQQSQTRYPGKSLREIANDADAPDRTVFSEYHDGGSTTGSFMVRWGKWKFVYYAGLESQLFDLEADPNELRDLIASGDSSVEVAQAKQEGLRRLREICDPEAVNVACFKAQREKIALLGGEEACLNNFQFNHTPTPVVGE